MILTVGGTKGGSGKSTLATNIAAWLAHEGKDFILVDTDGPQATSAKWVERRNDTRSRPIDEGGIPDLPTVNCVQKTGNVYNALRDLEQRYGIVLVDAGGADSQELRTAITASDCLYVPLRASIFDLETLDKLEKIVSEVKDVLNPDISVFAVLSQAPANPSIKEAAEAREFIQPYPFLTLCENSVCDRTTYRLGVRDGRGAVEMSNGTAKAEIQLLCEEIFNHD